MDNHLILLVDDEPAILEMLVTIFTQAGYTNLATASDGAGALAPNAPQKCPILSSWMSCCRIPTAFHCCAPSGPSGARRC